MRRRITLSFMAITLISILLVLILGLSLLYANHIEEAKARLMEEAIFVSASLAQARDPIAYLAAVDPNPRYGGRMSYLSPEGDILYDTYYDQREDWPNQLKHPEIADALETGTGYSRRYSDLHRVNTLFQAVLLPNGYFLRLATPLNSIRDNMLSFVPAALITAALVLLLSMLFARRVTHNIIGPFNSLNLDNPLDNIVYDEMIPLLTRIDAQNHQIEKDMREREEQRRRFNAVVGHMQEGLLLLDIEQRILAINNSTVNFFHVEGDASGRHVLDIHDTPAMRTLMTRATAGKYCDAIDTLLAEGKEYFLMCDPVREDDILLGFVVTVLDITFARETERMRREFSSNVSHELKTPLTSISGYAEIMMNGIAKEADMRQFACRIHEECMRLRDMIDGVMLLSRLDESGDALPFESVDLLELACQEVEKLVPLAEEHSVTLHVTGMPAHMRAIPRLMEEMLHNLIENGILYNTPGGKVTVQVKDMPNLVILTVADTGIGISEEAQPRIFERFFRLEKSRSKHLGGTGLGLAIVKHCARLHGAEIQLNSQEGTGTTFRVIFDKLHRTQ